MGTPGYSRPMAPVAHAEVWHHYLDFFILFPTIARVAAIIIGYLAKVVAPKYGRR